MYYQIRPSTTKLIHFYHISRMVQIYTTMNQQSETHEFNAMFAEDMAEIQKLYSMTEKLSLRLKVMKETYEQVMPIHY